MQDYVHNVQTTPLLLDAVQHPWDLTLTSVLIAIQDFWDIALCCWANSCWPFKGACCLYLQCSVGAAQSSQTTRNIYWLTRCHIHEELFTVLPVSDLLLHTVRNSKLHKVQNHIRDEVQNHSPFKITVRTSLIYISDAAKGHATFLMQPKVMLQLGEGNVTFLPNIQQ